VFNITTTPICLLTLHFYSAEKLLEDSPKLESFLAGLGPPPGMSGDGDLSDDADIVEVPHAEASGKGKASAVKETATAAYTDISSHASGALRKSCLLFIGIRTDMIRRSCI
jgi:hypothetical protein